MWNLDNKDETCLPFYCTKSYLLSLCLSACPTIPTLCQNQEKSVQMWSPDLCFKLQCTFKYILISEFFKFLRQLIFLFYLQLKYSRSNKCQNSAKSLDELSRITHLLLPKTKNVSITSHVHPETKGLQAKLWGSKSRNVWEPLALIIWLLQGHYYITALFCFINLH